MIIFMFLYAFISAVGFCVPQKTPCPTPLLVACHDNHLHVASYLIRKGARINYKNTVIHYLYC